MQAHWNLKSDATHLGVEAGDENGRDTEHAVIEGDLLGSVVPHGPDQQDVPVAGVWEALSSEHERL